MWFTNCIYCNKEIKESEPCYPVYSNGHKDYRHTTCYPPVLEQPKDYAIPFGHVTDTDGELD